MDAELRIVGRAVGKIRDELRRLSDENCFTIDYLLSQPSSNGTAKIGGLDGQKSIMNGEVSIMEDGDDEEAEWIGLE